MSAARLFCVPLFAKSPEADPLFVGKAAALLLWLKKATDEPKYHETTGKRQRLKTIKRQ